MTDRRTNLELKKHVATIHSSNKLSLVQRKISNALLYNAYNELLEKDEHTIHIAQLCKLIGYNSNDYKAIKKALVDLLSTVLEWNIVDGSKLASVNTGIWNASSIIADASIDGPICTYSYSNKMKRLLYRPELYGRLNMAVQAKFKSSYGLALYENCIRYQDIGQTPWLDLLKFRKLMGVEEGKYKIFRDFKSRVLDKALEEVNMYSPISIQLQLRKQGRQILAIQFLIQLNQQLRLSTKSADVREKTLSDLLKNQFGFSQRQTDEILGHYSEKYIREKIGIVESSKTFQSGKIHNVAKYLLSAIKDDYQSVKIIDKEKSCIENNIIQEKILKEQERAIKKTDKAYAIYREKFIDAIIAELDNVEKQKFMQRFFQISADAIKTVIRLQRGKYTMQNITESPQIQALMRVFATQALPHKLKHIKSKEQFFSDFNLFQQEKWPDQNSVIKPDCCEVPA